MYRIEGKTQTRTEIEVQVTAAGSVSTAIPRTCTGDLPPLLGSSLRTPRVRTCREGTAWLRSRPSGEGLVVDVRVDVRVGDRG